MCRSFAALTIRPLFVGLHWTHWHARNQCYPTEPQCALTWQDHMQRTLAGFTGCWHVCIQSACIACRKSSYYSTVPLIIIHVQCSVFGQVCFSLNTHIRHCISASGHHGSSFGLSCDLVEQCRVANQQHMFIYENSDMNYSSFIPNKKEHIVLQTEQYIYTLSSFIDTRTGSMPVNIATMCTDRTSPHPQALAGMFCTENWQDYVQIRQGGADFAWCPNIDGEDMEFLHQTCSCMSEATGRGVSASHVALQYHKQIMVCCVQVGIFWRQKTVDFVCVVFVALFSNHRSLHWVVKYWPSDAWEGSDCCRPLLG